MRLRTRILPAALAAATLLAGCQPTPPASATGDASTRPYGRIAFRPCVLTSEQGLPPVEAQCASFPVAENPAQPDGRRIALNIAWLPADNKGGGTPDPVFFLAGGPGQAATDYASAIDMALNEVRRQRDIVLIDQRGTGKSNPLDCRDAKGAPLPLDDTAVPDEAALSAYVGQCLKSLQGRADPRFYTTGEAIADLDAVRAALGVEKINVMGGSYGTRVAQQYAMHYPQHTRSVVLDGVAPNRLVVGGEFAQRLDEALRKQDAQCAKLPACKARFAGASGGDLIARLHALKARLAATPVQVRYHDPDSNALKQDTLTADTLIGLVHGVSYVPQLSSLLPLVVSEAEQGRYESLMAIAKVWSGQVGDQLNRGMQWSVVCAEDAPRYRPDPADADTVLGPDMARMFFAACPQWPRGKAAADFTAPFKSDLPVLVISGELDPVTPPVYGEEVVKNLRHGRHLVLRGQGHGGMGVGCMPKLLGRFFETTDAKALDATCLDSLSYVPPFTSFNGWEP
ncbi:pimeloyl-ACP methyl ester carboxylesterase [Lysobacter niabensis]|uniref:Pimeloyl-ACP methyl ester carboxylesterase n=1 Tax=Agrilutibacter niabensis TaxID=380628 RepID=A0ABU1VRY7_9GAMM|nr:alpha/beta fold hydrolase [Lysobacter niabensis]MDR7100249.1 pimeloyl-ACP methyl ester carboxylesterase [Lysobacter niabensis]